MKEYTSARKRPSGKELKDYNPKIGHRTHGSTHSSPTKERIERAGKRRARQEAKRELKENNS